MGLAFFPTQIDRVTADDDVGGDVAVLGVSTFVCLYVVVQTEPFFEAYWSKGVSLGDRAGAEQNFRLALAIDPVNERARNGLARAERLDEVIELDPDRAMIVQVFGDSYTFIFLAFEHRINGGKFLSF